jgi:predicted signal transduction protein with EAL and GGDEF domain
MYMERIEIPLAAAIAEPKLKPIWLKVPVGLLFLLTCAILMACWSVLVTAWLTVCLVARTIIDTSVFVFDFLVYSGEAVLGR